MHIQIDINTKIEINGLEDLPKLNLLMESSNMKINKSQLARDLDYEQVYRMGQQSVIAYNKRNEPGPIGFDEHFAPTCFREHSYRYDSYDAKYGTLNKEYIDCPLANEGICQKVFKMKITKDLRKYTAPARGSKAWKKIYNQRTAVERVNAYLKEFFQLNNVRYRTGKRAKIHIDIVTLVYNASKLAVDRLNNVLQNQTQVA